MVLAIWNNRGLILSLSERQLIGRYRGSIIASAWPYLIPLVMMAIYTFIFSMVFKARWNFGSDSKLEFALLLYLGLIVFNIFSECVNSSTTLIVNNINYVTKVVFPLEILPVVTLISALYNGFISLSIWMVFHIFLLGLPPTTIVCLPFVILPLVFFTLGLSWMLAAIGVYIRDLSQIISLSISLLMFLSPVFYPITSIPISYQFLFRLNPLTPAIEFTRNTLIWGVWPVWKNLFLILVLTALIAWSGFFIFQKLRKGFTDVL
jgi:lipopolysaccharide transport system permease protein